MTIDLVVQPVQILVGIALLLYTLGYSALVGLAVLVCATPLQGESFAISMVAQLISLGAMFVRLITHRHAQMKVVDNRVRLLSEVCPILH